MLTQQPKDTYFAKILLLFTKSTHKMHIYIDLWLFDNFLMETENIRSVE